MSDECPKCGYDKPRESRRRDGGGIAADFAPHEVGGWHCLEHQLAQAKAENAKHRAERDMLLEDAECQCYGTDGQKKATAPCALCRFQAAEAKVKP